MDEGVLAMTGKSHTDKEAKAFALEVKQKLNDKCKEWKEEEKTNSSGLVDDLFADGFHLLFIVCLERRMTQIEL